MDPAPDAIAPLPDLQEVRQSALRWRWLLGGVVGLVAVLLWGTWWETTTYERREALRSAAQRQANLGIAVGHYLGRALSNADAVGQYLAGMHAAPGTDLAAQLEARARANDLFAEMALCQEDGGFLAYRVDGAAFEAAAGCAGWLQEAPPRARSHAARPVSARGQAFVPFVTRVPAAAGRPAGALVLLVDVRRLLGLLQDYSLPDDTSVAVAGADGAVRARWHSRAGTSDQRAPEVAALPAVLAAGVPGQAHRIEGRVLLLSAQPMSGWPLTVLVATSEADTLALPAQRSRYYLAACVLATALVAGFALVLLRLQGRMARLSESLVHARQQLQRSNADLEGQVRARTGELQRAYADLETFSYAVAHDVRAPIGAIRGFADALEPRLAPLGDEKASHYLQRIIGNATSLSRMADALLALGKLTRAVPGRIAVDLSALCAEVVAGLREREQAPRAVDVAIEPGLRVRGDPVLLRQVMENLLANAWKFTARRERAAISVARAAGDAGQLTLVVRDNGAGFEMATAPALFQPFTRAHAAGDFPGTGVGLAVVERIVRLHGGRAWIESAPGEGTAVFLTLPAEGGLPESAGPPPGHRGPPSPPP